MSVLVTGGAGYIGSHIVKLLQSKNYEVVIFDNLSRGHIEAIPEKVIFENVDLLDEGNLNTAIKKYKIDSCIHFAAFAYVNESVENPKLYYQNNIVGSFNLIKSLQNNNISKIVFSSTCSVYGDNISIPISETAGTNPINPYAKTKLMIEQILQDFDSAYEMKFVSLRYFNAAGASIDGSIGESHNPETHLIPLVLFAALDKVKKIFVYGNDYQTKDGSCIRDFIHVEDLADAHLKALEYLQAGNNSTTINLGTGAGNSVFEVINLAKEITEREIKFEITNRRAGDPAALVADNRKAKEIIGWMPKHNLKSILKSAWQWHQNQKY